MIAALKFKAQLEDTMPLAVEIFLSTYPSASADGTFSSAAHVMTRLR
jgi:hypothetical protein